MASPERPVARRAALAIAEGPLYWESGPLDEGDPDEQAVRVAPIATRARVTARARPRRSGAPDAPAAASVALVRAGRVTVEPRHDALGVRWEPTTARPYCPRGAD